MAEAIGIILGKTSTHGFKFKISGDVKKWDYIQVRHPDVGPILCQVNEIEKTLKEGLADCSIIGHRTERGFLRKPRTPLEPNTEIFPAEGEFIATTLGLKKAGLYIGLLEGKDNLKTFLEPKKLISKHLAILAKSGAGKSYTVGVLLEELATLGVPCVILDPHGEYSTLKYPNDHDDDQKYFAAYGVEAHGFSKQIKELAINTLINIEAEQIKIPVPNTPTGLIESFPFKLSSAQKGLLYTTVNNLREKKARFNFEELATELEFTESNAKWKLISGLKGLASISLFSFMPTPISEIIKPGQLTIINMKGAPEEIQEIVANIMLTEIFEQRKMEKIPPFFLIIEEAHNFCPDRGFGEKKSSRILRAIASEGRKFGLGLCIISQRPARVDKSVLSQCTSQIALQVTNPNDLSAISKSFEGITKETEREIRNLPIGKALVIGASDYPVFVDIRVRRSKHGGRAQTFDIAEPTESGLEVENAPGSKKMVYIFEPRISRQDVKTMETQEVKDISVVLVPVLSFVCSRNGENFQLVFDMNDFSLYTLDDKLRKVKIPKAITNLSPSQKRVLVELSEIQGKTASELFVKTGLNFSEVTSIVETLWKNKLVKAENNKAYAMPGVNLNLSRFNFMDKPLYSEEPPSEKIEPKLKEKQIVSFLQSFDLTIESRKQAYIPFFKIRTPKGDKIVDTLSYSLTIS